MDSRNFDALTRALTAARSRRGALGLLATLPLLGGRFPPLDLQARKKKRKKKKTCKSSQKKCGKRCIPLTGCCSSAECGASGACVNNTCSCASGFKNCNGACIPNSDCCRSDDCPGVQVCTGGDCACPSDTPNACPGDVCVNGNECCVDSDCGIGAACDDGSCHCPAGEVICGDTCCDVGPENEVCKIEFLPGDNRLTCQDGGCPETNFCADPNNYVCRAGAEIDDSDCVCLTSIDNVSLCSDSDVECAIDCSTDTDCQRHFGPNAYCIPMGRYCETFCLPRNRSGVCVYNSCSSAPERARRDGNRLRPLNGKTAR
jgi:hypothetical protein